MGAVVGEKIARGIVILQKQHSVCNDFKISGARMMEAVIQCNCENICELAQLAKPKFHTFLYVQIQQPEENCFYAMLGDVTF